MDFTKKAKDLARISFENIIGNIAWIIFIAIGTAFISQILGFWNTVLDFAVKHTAAAIFAVISLLITGIFIGAMIQQRLTLRIITAKSNELKEARTAQEKTLFDLQEAESEINQLKQQLTSQRERFGEDLFKKEKRIATLEHRELDENQFERYMNSHTIPPEDISALFQPKPQQKIPQGIITAIELTADAIEKTTSPEF